jgi:hypothetical protein
VTALFIKTVQSGYDQNDDKDDKNNRSKFSRDGLERSYCEICCKFRNCTLEKCADCAELAIRMFILSLKWRKWRQSRQCHTPEKAASYELPVSRKR